MAASPQESSLSDSLHLLSDRLKRWNNNVFGNIFHRKRELLARLADIEKALAMKHNNYLVGLKRKLTDEYIMVLDYGETFWKQKSRCRWILQGDRNTSFFSSFYCL